MGQDGANIPDAAQTQLDNAVNNPNQPSSVAMFSPAQLNSGTLTPFNATAAAANGAPGFAAPHAGAAAPATGASAAPGPGDYDLSTLSIGSDGTVYGVRRVISGDPNVPGSSKYDFQTIALGPQTNLALISLNSGIPVEALRQRVGDLLLDQQQNAANKNTLNQGSLLGKNPDGSYAVRMPDHTIQAKSLQDLSSIPGITGYDIMQADTAAAKTQQTLTEANWNNAPVQLYNGGQTPTGTTINPQPPQFPAQQPLAMQQQTATPQMAPPQPMAVQQPRAAPQPMAAQPTPTPPPQGQPMTPGMLPMGAAPAPASAPSAPSTPPPVSGGFAQPRATTGGFAQSGATRPPASGVGNYGNADGTNQQYQLDTQGLDNQIGRGNATYQLGTPAYANPGETRQQYSQRIQDLQNQFNMGKSQFDLSQQGATQANEAQKTAVAGNTAAQLGQSRSLSGMGLGNIQAPSVPGLR